jgi:purine-binding chemotaxis protein CheW
VSPDDYEETPDTIEGIMRDLVQGVYKLDGKLLLILDTEKAVHVVSMQEKSSI